jgi:hypothetical protein
MAAFQFKWLWCNKCQGLAYAGYSAPGICPAGGRHDHTGSIRYFILHDAPEAFGQDNWRWCNKCQGLAYAGNSSLGPCPAGGIHDHSGSANYKLGLLNSWPPRSDYQDNWRWCNKCQGLAYAGNAYPGACPAGGEHDHNGSGDYALTTNMGSNAPNAQDNWQWCNKCQVLAYAGDSSPGACSAGGTHDHQGSADYALAHDLGATAPIYQDGWRWCNKCKGLVASAVGACSAGGTHDQPRSYNYGLYHDTPTHNNEQSNWRWCSKCQGLAYTINAVGPCPAGGAHDTSRSYNYRLDIWAT